MNFKSIKYDMSCSIPDDIQMPQVVYKLYKDGEHVFTTTREKWLTAFELLKESYPMSTVVCIRETLVTLKRQ